jgi:hypothetical protein
VPWCALGSDVLTAIAAQPRQGGQWFVDFGLQIHSIRPERLARLQGSQCPFTSARGSHCPFLSSDLYLLCLFQAVTGSFQCDDRSHRFLVDELLFMGRLCFDRKSGRGALIPRQ